MNQHKSRVLWWVLLLLICTAVMSSCIHPEEGDYPTMPVETTGTGQQFTTPEESTPEHTTPESTTPAETTPDVTSPNVTTTEIATPTETTTPEATTTPEETTTPLEETTTPPDETTPPEETTTDPSVDSPVPDDKIKIYIDQGHNPFLPKQNPDDPNRGWNTGASNPALGLYEQDLTYEIGMILYELLMQDGRFEVRLSRPTADTILGTDNDSALDFRVNDAKEWGADYFISLHTNSYADPAVRGLEVYTADGDEVGYDLGEGILKSLAKATELRNRGMKDGSNLRVLKNATMPAVLVEMGFISNAGDAALLDESPELFAQGIYNGILSYFNNQKEEHFEVSSTCSLFFTILQRLFHRFVDFCYFCFKNLYSVFAEATSKAASFLSLS